MTHTGPVIWRFPKGGNPNDPRTIVAVELCPMGHLVATHRGPWAGSMTEARAGRPPRVVTCDGATT